jgi:hypothetical protein
MHHNLGMRYGTLPKQKVQLTIRKCLILWALVKENRRQIFLSQQDLAGKAAHGLQAMAEKRRDW